MPATVLILPGIGNSGPLHWQSIWEQSQPEFVRVQQRDWDNPICEEWVAAIEEAVKRAGPEVVLVAHSLACLAVAHWAAKPHSPIKAALLVAVPDSKRPDFPDEAVGFSDTPTQPFLFRTTVVVVPMIHMRHRNTPSNLRRLGEAVSFISVVAVTSMQAAASARGQRDISYSANCEANPLFEGTAEKLRVSVHRRLCRRAASQLKR